MECTKICAKIVHADFVEVVKYGKANFVENVHFRISLRETLKMPRYDAKKSRKNLPVAVTP